jgi:predicted transcriptional regulator
MKAVQLMTRNVQACSVVDPLEQATQITREFPGSGFVVIGNDRRPVHSVTDQELARAAFTQAVALYDSCAQYAMTFRFAGNARQWRKATAAK